MFSYLPNILLNHSHDILYESEAAPWLACTPIT